MWSEQQEAALKDVQEWLKNGSEQVFLLFGFAGTGKAQPLTAKIQTPKGPVRMGDIQIGDKVIGQNGLSTTVTGVFPQGVKPTYRITFRDGSTTECCDEHLWQVTNGGYERRLKSPMVVTTKQLLDYGIKWKSGDMRWRIPLCKPVEFDYPNAVMDPYLIGVLLGDGSIKRSRIIITCKDDEIISRIKEKLPEGYEITSDYNRNCPSHRIKYSNDVHWNPIIRHIETQGINVGSLDKFIPKSYLYAPIDDRIELLRGLMDTDGSICNNRVSFSTTSPSLAEDVRTLVQSLGGTVITHRYERVDKNMIEYQLNVKVLFNPFNLKRKADRWKPSKKNPPSRFISSIEKIDDVEQQCISVDAEDHLYLTDEFIVTHNTTLAQEIASNASSVLFGAYTGKAAQVMRSKGCTGAQTIHSMIYKLIDNFDEEDDNKPEQQPIFTLNHSSPILNVALVIIDECSMVDEEIGRDLLSYGTKILVLGDPFQLPPISGAGFFTSRKPHVMLTEIHRQAADNPIIALSMAVREGIRLEYGKYDESMIIPYKSLTDEMMVNSDQMIAGLNQTRKFRNEYMRSLLGRKTFYPEVGDKLVCLKNDKRLGLFNGGVWTANESSYKKPNVKMEICNQEEIKKVRVREEFFNGKELTYGMKKKSQEFDYGYVLTCHKSQGSQWNNVLVFDESASFREEKRRWLYTAITRSAEKLILVK